MGWENLREYNYTFRMNDELCNKVGYPMSLFVPLVRHTTGYEDQGTAMETGTLVPNVANRFTYYQTKGFLNFAPKKGVFYHFNMDPDASENKELVQGCFLSNSLIREDCYIRTSTSNGVAPVGDHIFVVVKVCDDGVYRTLQRTYFLRPVSDSQLYDILNPSRYRGTNL